MSKTEKKIEELVQPEINNNGFELYDVEYVKEGKEKYLRIFIEKNNGTITLEDCELISNIINPLLDQENIIDEQYYLEVSSTGIEKKLRKIEHYRSAKGIEIEVSLFKKRENGKKEVKGILLDCDKKTIKVNENDNIITINYDEISCAKTVYKW